MDRQTRINVRDKATRVARGLGWFSIGLGIAELFFARPLARAIGLRGEESLLRFYGVREIATGIGTLAAKDPGPWVWGRVAGDAVDIATLAARFDGYHRNFSGAAVALGAVAGVTALDLVTAQALTTGAKAAKQAIPDYSDRSGLPKPPEAMRGAARHDFEMPRDMGTPPGMRPTMH